MKFISLSLLTFFLYGMAFSQSASIAKHIFIITTDGLRWQEVFGGANPDILGNPLYVKDTALIKNLYGDSTAEQRRRKLMPFFWNLIAENGQLYGNRQLGNKVNVKNFFKISYPGYNELLTGYADPIFIPNIPMNNRTINILEYLNKKPDFAGKVVVFSSWNIFPFILNEKRNGLPINSGYRMSIAGKPGLEDELVEEIEKQVSPKSHTRHDMLTYFSAREYISREHPKIVLLGLGETDEFAHQGRYDLYLQQATAFDKMIAELWYYVQTDPFYKDNTVFIITTDHGRGERADTWSGHGIFTRGSGETWFAILGPDIREMGELRNVGQVWQKQMASTIGLLIGEKFNPPHHVAAPISIPMKGNIDGNTAGRSDSK
ncbi:MAG: hypothetical protein ACHQET_09700 [Chitinophagales bacterium]